MPSLLALEALDLVTHLLAERLLRDRCPWSPQRGASRLHKIKIFL